VNINLSCICLPSDIQSIPSFWEDSNQHIKNVIIDLLGMENASQANEIAEMALSYYAGDEIITNQTLTGKHIDVSIRDSEVQASETCDPQLTISRFL
jgi:hypothetical protein